MKTLGECWQIGRKTLKDVSNTVELDLNIIINILLEKKQRFLDFNYQLNQVEERKFFTLLNRRALSEPMAYIEEKKGFWKYEFVVRSGVLIPRPDSEVGVEYIINYVSRMNKKITIGEFGVGSGCLICSILLDTKYSIGYGYENQLSAYRVAKENVSKHRLSNRLHIKYESWELCRQRLDIILSNPPYIGLMEMNTLMTDVKKYEPRNALYGGSVLGARYYRSIFISANRNLKNDGIIVVEIGYTQSLIIKKIGLDNGYICYTTLMDISGHTRYLCFRKLRKL